MTAALFLFLLLSILIPLIRFHFMKSGGTVSRRNIKVIGHRGAAGLAPENTLASFRKAMEIGVDFIELDIHMAKDGALIVMHDSNVKRTTNGDGEIGEKTFADLSTLDAGSWFDSLYSDERIPRLEEVLDLVKGRSTLLIEVKWPKTGIYSGIVSQLVHVIRKHHAESWVVIQSFEPGYLRELSVLAPEIRFHQLLFGEALLLPIYFDRTFHFGRFKPIPGASSINFHYRYLSKRFVRRIHQQADIFVFTVNDRDDIRKAIQLGADGIISDFPDTVRDIVKIQ